VADGELLHAYLHNDMQAWKAHVDTIVDLPYEYGYCAALLDQDKEAAKPYVQRFRQHVEAAQKTLPKGHYEMYMSAVYVYELRLHESFHPVKSLDLAREAVKLAPNDPMALTYCGTALFYAPKPFGNKKEALQLFHKAEQLFQDQQWYNCWWRPAAMMYIAQCYDKAGDIEKAVRCAQELLRQYPEYEYIKYDYLPALILRAQ
jgi:tetratricopeptide (TPR) repeat protein